MPMFGAYIEHSEYDDGLFRSFTNPPALPRPSATAKLTVIME